MVSQCQLHHMVTFLGITMQQLSLHVFSNCLYHNLPVSSLDLLWSLCSSLKLSQSSTLSFPLWLSLLLLLLLLLSLPEDPLYWWNLDRLHGSNSWSCIVNWHCLIYHLDNMLDLILNNQIQFFFDYSYVWCYYHFCFSYPKILYKNEKLDELYIHI